MQTVGINIIFEILNYIDRRINKSNESVMIIKKFNFIKMYKTFFFNFVKFLILCLFIYIYYSIIFFIKLIEYM